MSALSRLNFLWLVVFWISFGIIFGKITVLKFWGQEKPVRYLSNIPSYALVLCSGVALYALIVGVIAIIAPPNNADSMTYHMVRVAHWIQNGGVGFFPANYAHNVFHTPWAEFAITHLQILSSSDRFANIVQWFSMVGSVIGVSLIAKQLGADLRGQIFSAVFCVTIPMGVLQASSTQNDYVVTFWLLCMAYSVLRASKKGIDSQAIMKIGASFGLALLTKGTAYFYGTILFCWFMAISFKDLRWHAWKSILIAALIALSLNAVHYWRIFDLTGSPIPPFLGGITIRDFGIPLFLSNVLRNFALHCTTPFASINSIIEQGIGLVHTVLGVDVSDPRITEFNPVITGFRMMPLRIHEDLSGNPIHFIFILICVFIFLVKPIARKRSEVRQYFVAIILCFCALCLFIKWNPFNSRYQLPLFVLFSPFAGVMLATVLKSRGIKVLSLLFLVSSLPWLLCNEIRPLIGKKNIFNTDRVKLYFGNRPDLAEPSIAAAEFIRSRDCNNIGIYATTQHWEYPFWVLLTGKGRHPIRIQNVGANNITKKKYNVAPFDKFKPCAIVCIDDTHSLETIELLDGPYEKIFSKGDISVFTEDR